jgi:hypothetical protein
MNRKAAKIHLAHHGLTDKSELSYPSVPEVAWLLAASWNENRARSPEYGQGAAREKELVTEATRVRERFQGAGSLGIACTFVSDKLI